MQAMVDDIPMCMPMLTLHAVMHATMHQLRQTDLGPLTRNPSLDTADKEMARSVTFCTVRIEATHDLCKLCISSSSASSHLHGVILLHAVVKHINTSTAGKARDPEALSLLKTLFETQGGHKLDKMKSTNSGHLNDLHAL